MCYIVCVFCLFQCQNHQILIAKTKFNSALKCEAVILKNVHKDIGFHFRNVLLKTG